MKWELADGTVVNLGGDVEGTSAVAAKLRMSAARARKGAPDLLSVGMQPGGFEKLDLDDAQLVNVWVRTTAAKAGVAVLSAPDVEPIVSDEDPGPQFDADGNPVIY